MAQTQRRMPQNNEGIIFDSRGNRVAKAHTKTRTPKIVVDTVRLRNGYGTLVLNDQFRLTRHTVSGSSNLTVLATITPIFTDSTASVYTYAYLMKKKGKEMQIISSNSDDSGKVVVSMIVK